MSFRKKPLALVLSVLLPATAVIADPVEHSGAVDCSDRPLNYSSDLDDSYGAINPTGSPVGGGPNYFQIYSGGGAVVTNETELRNELAKSSPASVIYLSPTGNFHLTGTFPILIPANVTLASNRGKLVSGVYSEGALISVDAASASNNVPIFDTNSTGVRITGLRFQGPYDVIDESITQIETIGIRARSGATGIEIDNVDIHGWSNAAIYLRGAQEAHVHHNHIHRNHHQHFYTNTDTGVSGYGVVLYDDADALIEANIFDYNRHSIAGGAETGQSYEARYNIVQQHLAAHAFDMHATSAGGSGKEIYIHHNTFLTTQISTGVVNSSGQPSRLVATGVDIRGVPAGCAWIENNVFADADVPNSNARVIRQGDINPENRYEQTGNQFGATSLLAASGVSGEWQPMQWSGNGDLSTVYVGDFDGDGRSDLFRLVGNSWQIAYGGNDVWTEVNTTANAAGPSATLAFSDLRFGDFDGDGTTDVFFALPISGSAYLQWKMVPGGAGTTQQLASSVYPLSELRFADLDRDQVAPNHQKTDVLHIRPNGQWEISSGGTGAWTVIYTPTSTSPKPTIDEIAFGDFDGDKKTEAFYADGSQWRYFDKAAGTWTTLATRTETVADLLFGDFDGDGKTDALRFDSGSIDVSFCNTSSCGSWQTLNKMESGMSVGTTGVADFNGDGKAELLWVGTPEMDAQCTSSGCPLFP